MGSFEYVLALIGAAVVAAFAAKRLNVPEPIVMVLGGAVVALLPRAPRLEIPPELAFDMFVPPLLFRAAITTSARSLKRNARTILSLAVGLVAASAAVVAVVGRYGIGLPWREAFILGAILSPPDAVVGIGLARSLGAPSRVVSLVEGETLLNDATAFVLYAEAVSAATRGAPSIALVLLRFLLVIAIGVGVGYAVHWIIRLLRPRLLEDTVLANVAWLLTPFLAFLPAEALGGSGVTAVVVAGLLLRHSSPLEVDGRTRLRSNAVYDVVEFVLNSLVFILIGSELGKIFRSDERPSIADIARFAALCSVAIVLLRVAWIFAAAYLPRLVRRDGPAPPAKGVTLLAWMGMRGGDSLVTALAVPALAGRSVIVATAFGVILLTLFGQGLTLGPLIRAMRFRRDTSEDEEERAARAAMSAAAAEALDALEGEGAHGPEVIAFARAREVHISRLDRDDKLTETHVAVQTVLREAKRRALVSLRDRSIIDDSVLRKIERELDLEDERALASLDE